MHQSASSARRWHAPLALAVVVGLLVGCRLDVVAHVDVAADGSTEVEVRAALDEDLVATLDELAVDPTAELAALSDDEWRIERSGDAAGGLVLTARRSLAAAEVGDALRGLTADLSAGDPGLVLDLDVVVDAGAVAVDGTAGVRPPADAGLAVDGRPVGPSGDEVAALVDEAVDASLVVRTPGPVAEHDGEASDDGVVWHLPVGGATPVTLSAAAPAPGPRLELLVALAAGAVGLLVAVGAWVVRRRRRLSPGV